MRTSRFVPYRYTPVADAIVEVSARHSRRSTAAVSRVVITSRAPGAGGGAKAAEGHDECNEPNAQKDLSAWLEQVMTEHGYESNHPLVTDFKHASVVKGIPKPVPETISWEQFQLNTGVEDYY